MSQAAPVTEPRRASRATHPRLRAVAHAAPPHVVRQDDARGLFARLFPGVEPRLLAVFANARIEERRTCMPLEWYGEPHPFGERNARWIEHATALGAQAAERALERAGLAPGDVDHVVFVSTTGFATPSIDARLANVLGFRTDVRRTPVWGLGCAGGAAGLAHARDFALADPRARVLLVAVELCSLSFQHGDHSRRNVVAASLFADGAAAAVVCGAAADGADAPVRPGTDAGVAIELVDARSNLWPGTEDVMGWDVDGDGLHVVFSRDIPTLVRERLRPALEALLVRHGLGLGDVRHLVMHPGGAKVLDALADALELGPDALRHAVEVLRRYGNMSSPTCLYVLERALVAGDVRPGDHALLAALGPGFVTEAVLLRGARA